MQYRKLGRTKIEVSDIGYGAWGIAGKQWLGGTDNDSLLALRRAIALGVNLIDTALAYGDGHSEQLVGDAVRAAGRRIYVATKVPPKNRVWPGETWNADRRSLPVRLPHRQRRRESAQSQTGDHRPAATARLDRRVGGARRVAPRFRRPQALGQSAKRRRLRHRARSRFRARHHAHRADRRRPGDLQHLRPNAGSAHAAAGAGDEYRHPGARPVG